MIDQSVLIGGLVSLIGVIVGSFLNALVWRIHEGLPIGGKERSKCTTCNRTLAWYDLIPLASWLVLKAKCRYCKEKISAQYPVVEILNGLIWLVSSAVLKDNYVILAVWLPASSVLLALAVYDYKWMILPNKLVAWFCGLALLIAALNVFYRHGFSLASVADPLLGVTAIAGLFYLLFQVSNEKWIGGGDVKLSIGIGLLLGLKLSLVCLFLASLLGSVFGLSRIWLAGKSQKDMIAFGPFLIAATFVCFIWAEQIRNLFDTLIYL